MDIRYPISTSNIKKTFFIFLNFLISTLNGMDVDRISLVDRGTNRWMDGNCRFNGQVEML